jgi:hypothetical protein
LHRRRQAAQEHHARVQLRRQHVGHQNATDKPSIGKTRKVKANTRPCSRQCRNPANAARVDSRAPHRKNSPIARVMACLHSATTMPRAGGNDATPTVVSSSRMYGSIRGRNISRQRAFPRSSRVGAAGDDGNDCAPTTLSSWPHQRHRS